MNCPNCGDLIPENIVTARWRVKGGPVMAKTEHRILCERCAMKMSEAMPAPVVHLVSAADKTWTRCGFRVARVAKTTKKLQEATCPDCLRKVEQEINEPNAAA